ncbi:MAG TPA: hypothetical protein VGK73_05745 [Polyangiaceae bacterium]
MLRDFALGAIIGMVALGLPMACTSSGQLTPLARCKVDAVVRVVPEDPQQLTFADLVDVVGRLRQCHERADAGSP